MAGREIVVFFAAIIITIVVACMARSDILHTFIERIRRHNAERRARFGFERL
jgi:hypothetical protein